MRGARQVATDEPFAEIKEGIGGYYVLESRCSGYEPVALSQ